MGQVDATHGEGASSVCRWLISSYTPRPGLTTLLPPAPGRPISEGRLVPVPGVGGTQHSPGQWPQIPTGPRRAVGSWLLPGTG